LNTAQQLAMARATNAADLAANFAHSVAAFQTYSNGEPFYETGRKPLKTPQEIPAEIRRTEDFAAILRAQRNGCVENDASLNFRYVEREIVPARTTGGVQYDNGDRPSRWIRLDLLLAGELPILGELKLRNDNASAYYGLIQLLASASEMATAPQHARLLRYYSSHLPILGLPRYDLYLIFYRSNPHSKPKMEILDETRRLTSQLVAFPEISKYVGRIVALDADWTERAKITFRKRFGYSA